MVSRILLIAPQPFFSARGTPMNVLHMCRALTRGGYQVDLLTYPMGESVELPGLRILRAPTIPGIDSVPIGFSWRKLLLDLVLGLCVVRLLLKKHGRYLAVHAVEESVFLALPALLLGPALIYDLDSHLSEQLLHTGKISPIFICGVRFLERFALRHSRAAITVCRSLTKAVRELCPDIKVFQIEDAPVEEATLQPDPERVAALRVDLEIDGRPVMVYTGNLEPYQGIDLLLETADVLRRKEPELAIVIVGGESNAVARLREQVDQRGLGDQIHLVGARPPAEMAEWMALADVLISPRTQGGNTPLKIYSYMLSGRPIVATALETHTQVLDASSAVLCRPNAADMAHGVMVALRGGDEIREMTQRARGLAETNFSMEAFQFKLLSAYESLFGMPDAPELEPSVNPS